MTAPEFGASQYSDIDRSDAHARSCSPHSELVAVRLCAAIDEQSVRIEPATCDKPSAPRISTAMKPNLIAGSFLILAACSLGPAIGQPLPGDHDGGSRLQEAAKAWPVLEPDMLTAFKAVAQSLPAMDEGWKLVSAKVDKRVDGSVQAEFRWNNGSFEQSAHVDLQTTLEAAKTSFADAGLGKRIADIGDEALLWVPDPEIRIKEPTCHIMVRTGKAQIYMTGNYMGSGEEELKRYSRAIVMALNQSQPASHGQAVQRHAHPGGH